MLIQENMDLMDKLKILTDAAKYDVACTSSGTNRANDGSGIGNAVQCGICHSFAADGRCISLLKILLTNECIFNCRYCINRSSNDILRATFTPDEVCTLTMEFYRRNYIEGLFLSSGIINSPTYTMTQILEVVKKLRTIHHFNGYIHIKGIPGADASVIEEAGWYVDRMSINLELPTADGLKSLAPNKTRKTILTPMRQIQTGITNNRLMLHDSHAGYKSTGRLTVNNASGSSLPDISPDNTLSVHRRTPAWGTSFVPAGQSTQMIIGATPENDYQIVTVAEALYNNYSLKRVFYSAFVNVNNDSSLPMPVNGPPLLREHRLYQADWLLRFYGFKAAELLSESKPDFNVLIDPKCDWALRHLEMFPVEINRAPKHILLRIPGVGPRSVERILRARRSATLDFNDLKKLGVVLKRARYFITCNGHMEQSFPINEDFITSQLIGADRRKVLQLSEHNLYQQITLFDTNNTNFKPLQMMN